MPSFTGGAGSNRVAQIVVKATLASAGSSSIPVYTTFYYERPAGAGVVSKTALKNIFASSVFAPMLAAFNDGYGSASCDIRWIDDALDAFINFSLAGAGAIATDRAASYNAVYMLLKTGIRGKQYRSSKHFAAVNEVDTTGDVLTGAGLVRWQAIQTALLAPLTDANSILWTPCVVTRKGAQYKVNPTAVIYNDVVSVVLDLTMGTMRRRKVKTVT